MHDVFFRGKSRGDNGAREISLFVFVYGMLHERAREKASYSPQIHRLHCSNNSSIPLHDITGHDSRGTNITPILISSENTRPTEDIRANRDRR